MIIYPAIDLYEGQVVRLIRGDYAQKTVYSKDPVSVAKGFENAGATHLHVVDLEAAREGRPCNFDTIAKIVAETGLFIQVGGGIRTEQTVEMYLSAGIRRVILGTAAVAVQGFLREMVSKWGSRVAVSADIKDGFIAIKGWTETSNQDALSFCNTVNEIGVKTIICTDISKDGMQSGSNVELYRKLQRELTSNNAGADLPCTAPADPRVCPIEIIASGGVSTIDEIKTLAEIGIGGAIIGKALYEGSISLKDVL